MASTSNNAPGTSTATTTTTTNNNDTTTKDKDNRWYFTSEQLANSPSRKHGIDADQELSLRQLTAYLIQDMGQRLQVSQLCINTAIVYMHRFYAFHSFTHFHRNGIAAAALFLAAKVEEQPRKLEHVIKVAHICLSQEAPHPSSDIYAEQAQDLVFNENVLLQTLGFDVAIDHPHTHVVKTCHLVKACKDLAQTSYFLASNSLHLTSMCLQYRPTVVACFCIYLACKWSRWEIPQSTEGRHWFHYVDKSVTMDLLKQLTDEFIAIYEKSPARLKSKLNSIKALAQGARIEPPRNLVEASTSNGSNTQVNQVEPTRRSESHSSHHRSHHSSTSSSHSSASSHHHHSKIVNEAVSVGSSSGSEHKSSSSQHKQPYPPTSGHSNRPRPERSQVPTDPQFTCIPHGVGKQQQQLPLSSSSRSSSGSNRQSLPSSVSTSTITSSSLSQHGIPPPVGGSNSTQQRISSHGHDSSVYHKSRVPPQVNPQLPTHKMIPKESIRPAVGKDSSAISTTSRSLDLSKVPLNKQQQHPNNNMYPPQNSISNVGLDMTRTNLQSQTNVPTTHQTQQQQQRSYLSQPSLQSGQYSQQSILNKQSSNRYDQSVQLLSSSTHIQSTNQKQLESSFGLTNPKSIIDECIKSTNVDQMEICSPSKVPYQQQNPLVVQHHHQQQPTQSLPTHIQQQYQQTLQRQQQHSQASSATSQQRAAPSIFSPEWNEKTQLNNSIANLSNSNSSNKLGFNTKSNRDSPKKSEKDRKSEMIKKDKSRQIIEAVTTQMPQGPSSQSQQQQQQLLHSQKFIHQPQLDKRPDSRNQELPLSQSSLSSSNSQSLFDVRTQQSYPLNFSSNSNNSSGGMKRRASRDNTIKYEEPIKDTKKIRTETQLSPKLLADQKTGILPPVSLSQTTNSSTSQFYNMYDQSSSSESKQSVKTFPINGIETNPDLVSSLLKESLCRETTKYATSLLKTEPKDPTESTIIDSQSIIMETLPDELLQTDVPANKIEDIKPNIVPNAIKVDSGGSNTLDSGINTGGTETDDYIKTKSEKKKKKDKHKHKEKDKSKDKDEKKKHKKDKDRHKDKERQTEIQSTSTEINPNPVKIKISKDKLNLPPITLADNINPSQSSGGFKIKIPKDRIKGELSNFQIDEPSSSSKSSQHYQQSPAPVSSLKIKISKDKIESFNNQPSVIPQGVSSYANVIGGNINSGSSTNSSHYHGNYHHYHGSSSGNISGTSSSNSSKKKDRDRDKEKKKSSSSSSDHLKQNINGSKEINTGTTIGLSGGILTSSSKNQAPTKMQQYNGNNLSMSQLFGESYDDDDDYGREINF